MNVIAGTVRGFHLAVPAGKNTRPTTGRIKETLFNIIQWEVSGSRFLDLFSGSGGIAIEALSRGAVEAVLVDRDREALCCMKKNLKHTRMEDRAQILAMDVQQALRRLHAQGRSFDIIFMDPPYFKDFEKTVIPYLLQSSLVHEGSLIIVETAMETDVSYMQEYPCRCEKIKDYKTNRHVFLRV